MSYTSLHTPVLLTEVREFLSPAPGMVIVDGTLGDGGHSAMLCEHVVPGGLVIGIDQDPEAVQLARERLSICGETFQAVHGNFADVPELVQRVTSRPPDRILLDLGWSTTQFMLRGRGFSFMTNEPLDMRFDPGTHARTAADILRESSVEELVKIFRLYGEEPRAEKIARELVRARGEEPITTTQQLAHVVTRVAPRTGKIHPATQVFQALRIAVNDELHVLQIALTKIADWIPPGARVAIITFHSLEDRVVKQFVNARQDLTGLTKKPITPSESEIQENPRSRSSKLRVFEKK